MAQAWRDDGPIFPGSGHCNYHCVCTPGFTHDGRRSWDDAAPCSTGVPNPYCS